MKIFYLTTPIYYVNARPHLGHAYTTIVADAIARFKRMCGYSVVLVTGTDEHGQKIERSAQAARIPPQQFVDSVSAEFRRLWSRLGLEYTDFVRTSSKEHYKAVVKIFKAVEKAGYLYKGRYRGRYCVFDEAFVSDTEGEANCPLCGRPAEMVEEENYFFKLSEFQQPLLDHYRRHPEFVQPESRRNEVVRFVEDGLKDLSISRKNIKWGIPMPGGEGHVFYVWFDALTSYLSGIGYGDAKDKSKRFEQYWPADVHLVGKEILRFHAVYWPAYLMAAGLPLPRVIFAHGWLLFDQEKMSKSKGNIVCAETLTDTVGNDGLRYYLMRDIVFGQDSRFSYEGLIQRFNSDLANDFGNLANRTLTMIDRYFHGKIPDPSRDESRQSSELKIQQLAESTVREFRSRFEAYEFSRALEAVWKFIAALNKYLVEMKPWALAGREDEASKARLGTVLYTSAEAVRLSAVLLYSVVPASAEKLWAQLGFSEPLKSQSLEAQGWSQLPLGQRIGKVEVIFPRLDKDAVLAGISATDSEDKSPQKRTPSAMPTESDQVVTIDDFTKVDLRVGEILTAESIQGASKLLKLTVDLGKEVRQVLAGVAEYYRPEDLLGMKVIVVANLKPRKMRGLESQGMVVAASVGEEGRPVFATIKQEVPNGTKLR